jgi:hypothetical protein
LPGQPIPRPRTAGDVTGPAVAAVATTTTNTTTITTTSSRRRRDRRPRTKRLRHRQYAVRRHLPGTDADADADADAVVVWESDIKPADAVTVHGAQGSEADTVVYVSPRGTGTLLIDQSFFYTAVSRGKRVVHLVGNRHSMSPHGLAGRQRRYRTILRLQREIDRRGDARLGLRTLLLAADRLERLEQQRHGRDGAPPGLVALSDASVAIRTAGIRIGSFALGDHPSGPWP